MHRLHANSTFYSVYFGKCKRYWNQFPVDPEDSVYVFTLLHYSRIILCTWSSIHSHNPIYIGDGDVLLWYHSSQICSPPRWLSCPEQCLPCASWIKESGVVTIVNGKSKRFVRLSELLQITEYVGDRFRTRTSGPWSITYCQFIWNNVDISLGKQISSEWEK